PTATPSCPLSWRVVASPNTGTGDNVLAGIKTLSATDAWAVGSYRNVGSPPQTLVQHWNGATWTIIPSPSISTSENYLYGIDAVSPTDIWAVGFFGPPPGGPYYSLIEHWDGVSWSIVPS